jgi:hypothetical protein
MVVNLRNFKKQYFHDTPVKPISGVSFDAQRIQEAYNNCATHLTSVGHKPTLQISITSSTGSNYENEGYDINHLLQDTAENKYSILNEFFVGTYVEEVYNLLDQMFGVTRGRFMLLNKHKRAYSYHSDLTPRIHIPISTDDYCMFIINDVVYKLPDVGQLYLVDTTKMHSALNLGYTERLHIVFGLKNVEM